MVQSACPPTCPLQGEEEQKPIFKLEWPYMHKIITRRFQYKPSNPHQLLSAVTYHVDNQILEDEPGGTVFDKLIWRAIGASHPPLAHQHTVISDTLAQPIISIAPQITSSTIYYRVSNYCQQLTSRHN